MEKLIVRNFGPIVDVEIELKDLTIFIGETGTGKSTLAKLIAIFRDAEFWKGVIVNKTDCFLKQLQHYQLADTFLKMSSYIKYEDTDKKICFVYENGKATEESFSLFLAKKDAVGSGKPRYIANDNDFNINSPIKQIYDDVSVLHTSEDSISQFITSTATSIFNKIFYLPADRGSSTFISSLVALIAKEKALGIIPPTLLDFIAYFKVSSSVIKRTPIGIFDVSYQKENGIDYVILSDGTKIRLSDAASGMQTLIPVLLLVEYYVQQQEQQTYIFEEPELNLFPLTQKKLVELLAAKVLGNGHKLVITTHSPYILTSANNLLLASELQEKYPSYNRKLTQILGLTRYIEQKNTVAYYINSNGLVDNLIEEGEGIIPGGKLDSVSNTIMDTFDELVELDLALDRANKNN